MTEKIFVFRRKTALRRRARFVRTLAEKVNHRLKIESLSGQHLPIIDAEIVEDSPTTL